MKIAIKSFKNEKFVKLFQIKLSFFQNLFYLFALLLKKGTYCVRKREMSLLISYTYH